DARQQAQAGHHLVIAGAGEPPVDLMRFVPQQFQIHAGQSVTWRNIAASTPHTVTFGPEPADPSAPLGTDRTAHATLTGHGQAVNSGFIGGVFPAGTDFTVTFTQPGTYRYRCALHDEIGMVGTIVVQP